MSSDNYVCVVVLGDIGRSPRITYHSLSLANEGFRVSIVAYSDSKPRRALLTNPNITIYPLPHVKCIASQPMWLPRIIHYSIKVIVQTFILLYFLLWSVGRPNYYLIQNPPSIPTFWCVWFASRLRSARFIIDWHNFGYTILSLTSGGGERSLLVRFHLWLEKTFGRLADDGLCVTMAMREDLKERWGIETALLYDRPEEIFRPLDMREKDELFCSLSNEIHEFRGDNLGDSTAFTRMNTSGEVEARVDRPALLVSSTSWTEDEDFDLLLTALQIYDHHAESELPRLLCCITGRGPLKEFYRNKINSLNLHHITILLPWLSAEDYPRLLGAADLGVCLHTSSSGLDLPMKVVDMFGCALPVCARQYPTLNELVKHGENGFVFKTSWELFEQMKELLSGFPYLRGELGSFRNNLNQNFRKLSWHENWVENALPLFKK